MSSSLSRALLHRLCIPSPERLAVHLGVSADPLPPRSLGILRLHSNASGLSTREACADMPIMLLSLQPQIIM